MDRGAMLLAAMVVALLAAPPHAAASSRSLQAPAPGLKMASGTACFDVDWHQLARSNQTFGSGTWGAVISKRGKFVLQVVPSSSGLPPVPLSSLDISDPDLAKSFKPPKGFTVTNVYSVAPDFPSIHTPERGDGSSYLINHFESSLPSTMYISKLAPADGKGNLKIVETRHVDASEVEGLWFTCSGSVTPWGSHLGSEEYPGDCRVYDLLFRKCKPGEKNVLEVCGVRRFYDATDLGFSLEFARYWGLYYNVSQYGLKAVDFLADPAAFKKVLDKFHCYAYGGSPEVTVLPGGKTTIKKWWTLGRISHELAVVMPDNRTVYTSDDNTGGVFLKFVADRPKDLSSGTLYAAKLSRQRVDPADNKTTWDVRWIKLAHGDQATLDKAARSNLHFADMFDSAEPIDHLAEQPECPKGFKPLSSGSPVWTHTDKLTGQKYQLECLKLKKGNETLAAFFEPRRYASMLNATTEFEKAEGLALNRRDQQLYLSVAKIGNAMTADVEYGIGTTYDIVLDGNKCGGVMSFGLDKDWSISSAKVYLQGDTDKAGLGGGYKCNKNNFAGPDNLHYVAGNLIIQEDASQHPNNFMWAHNVAKGGLTRIFSAPAGGEVSGIYANRVGDKGYFTFAVQHPDVEETPSRPEEIEPRKGYMGYIGPFPAKYLGDDWVASFDEVPVPTGPDTLKPIATKRVCFSPAKKG